MKYHSKMQESSLMSEDKFMNMMNKLSDEQKQFYAQKKQMDEKVKLTTDMAKHKVKELEDELEQRQKFFDSELDKYEQENEMLKEMAEGNTGDMGKYKKKIKALEEEVDKLKKERKEMLSVSRKRDVELQ